MKNVCIIWGKGESGIDIYCVLKRKRMTFLLEDAGNYFRVKIFLTIFWGLPICFEISRGKLSRIHYVS